MMDAIRMRRVHLELVLCGACAEAIGEGGVSKTRSRIKGVRAGLTLSEGYALGDVV